MKKYLMQDLKEKAIALGDDVDNDDLVSDVFKLIIEIYGYNGIIQGIEFVEKFVKDCRGLVFMKVKDLCLSGEYGLAFKTYLENKELLKYSDENILHDLTLYLQIDEYEKTQIVS